MENDSTLNPAGPSPAGMSLAGRLSNIFVSPGEVFDQAGSAKPSTGNWLAPVVLCCILTMVYTFIGFSQPVIQQKMRELQEQKLQQMVEKGQLNKQQAEAAQEGFAKFADTPVFKILASAGGVAFIFAWLFLLALGIWLLGTKILGGQFPYMRAVELLGLAGMIDVLALVIGILLMIAKGTMLVNVGPSFFIPEINPASKMHQVLLALNLFSFWYLAVLTLGLAKWSGSSIIKSGVWIFGVWIVLKFGAIISGVGMGELS